MLSTIKGYFDKGKIKMLENAPVNEKTEVIITFLSDAKKDTSKKRIPGALKGKVSIPKNFNEPLSDLKNYM